MGGDRAVDAEAEFDWPPAPICERVVKAILYIASTGCQWRMLPKDFPPFTTV